MIHFAENGLPERPCQRRPHYGEPCECEARLAAVVAHHVVNDPAIGPPFCQECSEAISEYVPWDAAHQARVIPPAVGHVCTDECDTELGHYYGSVFPPEGGQV